ncbi:MAG: DUF5057 domain-containing protein [Eubacteriales bacterium]|nr:DUF5057 domain-containing protein [Eubacteriales bacterium]
MERIGAFLKKYRYALLGFVACAVISFVAVKVYIGNVIADDASLPSSVTIGMKTYTKENKLTVLEIVPDEAYDELGVLMGNEDGSIKYSEILSKAPTSIAGDNDSNQNSYKSMLGSYQSYINTLISGSGYVCCYKDGQGNLYNDITSFWQYSRLNGSWNNLKVVICEKIVASDWSVTYKETGYRNVFGRVIFGNFDMDDKMALVVKKASNVTVDDIKNADLVYLNGKSHNAYGISVYNSIKNTSVTQGKTWSLGGDDFKSDVAMYLLRSYAMGDKSVISDSGNKSQVNGNYSNIARICILFEAIDPDTLISQFAYKQESSTKFTGSLGSITGSGNVIKVWTTKSGSSQEIEFMDDMFINGGNHFANSTSGLDNGYPDNGADYYPYYNASNGAFKQTFVNKNMFVFNGNNNMTSGMSTDTVWDNDYNSNGQYMGSTYMDAAKRLESGDNGLRPSNAVRYILGDYDSPEIADIRVLEIEPAGAYRYNNDADKNVIKSWFGLTGERAEAVTVTVDHYAVNAFVGLNKDIRADYDLIIFGAYDNNNINTSDVYNTVFDSDMTTGNYTYNGNDLTQKAYEKLYEYIRIGMPVVLDDAIYYGDNTIVGESCSNIQKLQITQLTKRLAADGSATLSGNVTGVNTRADNNNQSIPRVLVYMTRAEVSISPYIRVNGSVTPVENYSQVGNVDTSGNDSIGYTQTISSDSLSTMTFMGSVTGGSGNYRIKVYIDRDSDSIFSDDYKTDKSELFVFEKNGSDAARDSKGNILGQPFSGDSYSVAVPLPSALTGYIKWRVEITDTDTGVVSNNDGAFAITPKSSEKVIRVLQITNTKSEDSYDSNIDLTGGDFVKAFDRTKNVTGLNIKVDQLTKGEFNDISNKDEYLSSYSMIVLGLCDNYGNDRNGSNVNLTQDAVDAIDRYVDKGNSALFTHDSMSYHKGTADAAVTKASDLNIFTKKFKTVIGMQDGLQYTDTLLCKLNKLKPYNSLASNTGSTRLTTKVNKLNDGEITSYPYSLSDAKMTVAVTHAQYFALNHESMADNKDVVVWYTLASDSGYVNSDIFDAAGQDAVSNYYVYSVGNITYTSAGHSKITGEGAEMQLFVNTFVRALLAGNSVPDVEYKDAVKEDETTYSIYYRQSLSTDEFNITYTVNDLDLVSGAGQLQSAYMFYDSDNNGMYVSGTSDVILGYLDVDGNFNENKIDGDMSIVSGQEYTFDLWAQCDRANVNSSTVSEMKNRLSSNTLILGVSATDTMDSTGYSVLRIMYRPLFNLN